MSEYNGVSVMCLEFFWADQYIYGTVEDATMVAARLENFKFSFVPRGALKMDFLVWPVLRFLCKAFSKLLKFTL